MKKIGLAIFLSIAGIIALSIYSAGEMGDTSVAFARGKVTVSDDLLASAQGAKTLFIIVKDSSQPRPPFGAIKVPLNGTVNKNVYDFLLTYDNLTRMIPTKEWPAVYDIKVRLDFDGMGGMDQPGDLVGSVQKQARGANDLIINIDRKI
jgi:hypothetical protein